MTEASVRAGSVGRPHGLDGSFHLVEPAEPLTVGAAVRVGTLETAVERVAGTDERPIVRLRGVDTREAARALGGQAVLVTQVELPPGEYYAAELVGLRVDDLGTVRRVVSGPSCDVLEVGEDGVLVPFIRDAIRRVDVAAGTIEIDVDFLGLR